MLVDVQENKSQVQLFSNLFFFMLVKERSWLSPKPRVMADSSGHGESTLHSYMEKNVGTRRYEESKPKNEPTIPGVEY